MNQHKLEHDIYKCLTYGDEKEIAAKRGKGASYYAQMFSPDDTRESHFYRAAEDFEKWAEVNLEDAMEAFAIFSTAVSSAMHKKAGKGCLESTTCRTLKEAHDIAAAKISGASLYDQLKEVTDCQIQLRKHKNDLLDAINVEKASFNGGTTRYAMTNGSKK